MSELLLLITSVETGLLGWSTVRFSFRSNSEVYGLSKLNLYT